MMPLTRDFKETLKTRVAGDSDFGAALFAEAVALFLAGDVETGKSVLRDYINATVGFEALGDATGTPVKSLMRMLGPAGNPSARNLFAIISHLQIATGVDLAVARAA